MQKHSSDPRENWRTKVESQGLIWHSASEKLYWAEDSYYAFNQHEISILEDAGNECYKMLLEAGEYIAQKPELLNKFGIPLKFHGAILDSWDAEPPCLNYGRFDFGFDGQSPPKLFEFNCDTPTSLLEASVVQYDWKQELFPSYDQFNGIHEALVARWKEILPRLNNQHVWFTHAEDDAGEDAVTTSYMRDIATEAGLETHGIVIGDIGFDGEDFLDLGNHPMDVIQKLYPWEWMVNEDFGNAVLQLDHVQWLEPIWKMMWSNKAILPILWELFPNNEYLLPTFYEMPKRPFGAMGQMITNDSWVKKPILSREGANITILEGNGYVAAESKGEYGEEGYIYQERYYLPEFDGKYPVLGIWSVDGASVGMGIREDGLITGNTAKFVPHIFD